MNLLQFLYQTTSLEWMEIEAKKQRVFATSLGRRLLSAIFQLRAGYNLLISVHVNAQVTPFGRWLYQQVGTLAS